MLNSKLLKKAALNSLKSFGVNVFIGWVVCVFLVYLLSHSLNLFAEHTLTEFWDQLAFSIYTLTLPILVGSFLATLKFNKIYFLTEE